LSHDLNLTALNIDPLDGVAHQCARLGAPSSRGAVEGELGSGQLPAQDLDDQPLDIVGIDTGERARGGSAVMQQRAADGLTLLPTIRKLRTRSIRGGKLTCVYLYNKRS